MVETTVARPRDVLQLDEVRRRLLGAGEHDGGVERRERHPRVAVARRRDRLQCLVGDRTVAQCHAALNEHLEVDLGDSG